MEMFSYPKWSGNDMRIKDVPCSNMSGTVKSVHKRVQVFVYTYGINYVWDIKGTQLFFSIHFQYKSYRSVLKKNIWSEKARLQVGEATAVCSGGAGFEPCMGKNACLSNLNVYFMKTGKEELSGDSVVPRKIVSLNGYNYTHKLLYKI